MNNDIDLILKKVKKVWEANSELRLGQLLCSVANYGALYYSSNEDIIKLLEQFYKIDTSDVEKEEKMMDDAAKHRKYYKRKLPQNNGRIYIHNNEGKVKAVFQNDLDDYLNNGWRLGRKDL